MKKHYLLSHSFLFSFLALIPVLAQTFPRPRTVSYNRSNETENTNYEVDFPPCFSEYIISNLAFQGYDEGQATQGIGEVTYYYRFPNNDPSQGCASIKPKVSKPIVVLDGFDPGDTRAGAEVYGKYLKYNVGSTPTYLGVITRSEGNDVIILNFPQYEIGISKSITITPVPGQPPITIPGTPIVRDGGADYMERNAFVLIKLLQQLNQELRSQNSTEKITLIGPSMGGIISRYALAYMEKQFQQTNDPIWDANVKLWISFDSPHLGSNIPIGDQWMVNYLAGIPLGGASAKRARDQRLDSYAARQLLLHHFRSNSQVPIPAIVNGVNYRDRFLNNLLNAGIPNSGGQLTGFPNPNRDPAKVRKIALVNGSQSGGVLPGAACGQALRLEINKTVLTRYILFQLTWGLGTWTNRRLIETTAYFTPQSGGSCKVFEGASLFPYGLGIPGRTRFAQAYNAGSSLDLAPGGTLDIQNVIARDAKDSENAFVKVNVINPTPNHVFIPVRSALGFNWLTPTPAGIGNLSEDFSTRNLVCEGVIPFDSYYAPFINQEHVSLTAESAQWVLEEIRGNKQKPITRGNFSLTVSGQLSCTNPNSTLTASIPAQAAGSIYRWQVTGGLLITAGQGTSQITVKSNGGSNSTETIKVSVETTCSVITPLPYSFQKQGGFSSSDYPVSGPSSIACGQTAYYSTVNLTGATNYQWVNIPPTATNISGQGTRFLSFTVPSGISTMNVGVRVANVCDAGGSPATMFTSVTCAGARLAVYPNPASYELTVERKKEGVSQIQLSHSGSDQADALFSVQLYNSLGELVRQATNREGKVSFDVSQLPSGVYILKGKKGEQATYTERVTIYR